MDSSTRSKKKRNSLGRTDTGNIIQDRMYLALTSQRTMEFNGKAVGLILDPCDQLEPLAVPVDGNLFIIVIQPSGPVLIILYHTADRYLQIQLAQYLQRNVDLSPAAVHHDQIRKTCETSELLMNSSTEASLILSGAG